MVGIYKITSPSGGIYIGQSWDIKNRWRLHGVYNNTRNSNTPLYNSLKKYGFNNHKFNICIALPNDIQQTVLDEYEIFFISQLKEAGCRLLNLTSGGSHGRHAEESKKKLSDKRKAYDWCKGRKQSPETIEKRRAKMIGRKMSQKTYEVLSKWRTKEQAMWMGKLNKGIKRTQENKEKIRQTLLAKIETKGEGHGMAKLSNEDVMEIRAKYGTDGYTSRGLAKEYNLSKTNVLDILHWRIWKHI